MSLLSLQDLTLLRPIPLFSNLSLSITKGDRIGLVAANGSGKSSFLRILAGQEEATSGSITTARGLVVAFAPQDPPPHLLTLTLRDAVQRRLARRHSA
jgi:ATPase subunit of ABC transporter with duplicated ATPase domains